MSDDLKTKPAENPLLLDDPHAPVFYVDGVVGGGPDGSTFNLTFARAQFDYSGGGIRHYNQVVLRIVMPISGLQAAGEFVAQSLARLSSEGGAAPPPPIPKSNLN